MRRRRRVLAHEQQHLQRSAKTDGDADMRVIIHKVRGVGRASTVVRSLTKALLGDVNSHRRHLMATAATTCSEMMETGERRTSAVPSWQQSGSFFRTWNEHATSDRKSENVVRCRIEFCIELRRALWTARTGATSGRRKQRANREPEKNRHVFSVPANLGLDPV